MDVKELRVGNYYHQEETRIIERNTDNCGLNNITDYVEKDICLSISDLRLQISNTFNKPNLSPIELTEEWFVKFGFKKKDSELIKKIKGYNIVWNNRTGIHLGRPMAEYCFAYYKHIKYVHELQNLYSVLRKKELTL